MKIYCLLIVSAALIVLSDSANAQSQFAGRYDIIGGASTGADAGLFSYGTAVVSRNGRVAITAYAPYYGEGIKSTGFLSSRGIFSLREVTGSAPLVGGRVAVGNYRSNNGNGFFGLRKK
jgi:hypothetical protein